MRTKLILCSSATASPPPPSQRDCTVIAHTETTGTSIELKTQFITKDRQTFVDLCFTATSQLDLYPYQSTSLSTHHCMVPQHSAALSYLFSLFSFVDPTDSQFHVHHLHSPPPSIGWMRLGLPKGRLIWFMLCETLTYGSNLY